MDATNRRLTTFDAIMAEACEIAAGRVTLSWHEGDDGHRAVRITGCWPETAARVGREIQEALFGPADPETGLLPARYARLGFRQAAGFAAVWIR